MIENDPHRPIYHFTGPESWINDPNGPIYHAGQYHLFYQFAPMLPDAHGGWRRSPMCWGHAVSTDLVHWVDWPVALWPDTPYDRAGVYSGNTVIDSQGFPCALYTGNVAGHRETYGMLARSTDGWITWQKTMVMDNSQRPNADSPVHWDGQVWREGDRWCQLVGGTTGGSGRQGAAWLWTSPDLNHWTLQKNIAPSIKYGDYWELPYLIPLGGRHVLLAGCGNPCWVGTYDAQSMLFTPDDPRPASIDNGTYYSFNVNMVDDKGPGGSRRQLMHGWVTGPESPTKTRPLLARGSFDSAGAVASRAARAAAADRGNRDAPRPAPTVRGANGRAGPRGLSAGEPRRRPGTDRGVRPRHFGGGPVRSEAPCLGRWEGGGLRLVRPED